MEWSAKAIIQLQKRLKMLVGVQLYKDLIKVNTATSGQF